MSLLTTDVSSPLGTKIASESSASASTVNQIDDSAGTIYQIQVTNIGGGTDVYLKLWDATGSTPTVGSDAPAFVLRCLAGATVNVSIPGGIAYTTALWAAAVSASGGTAGTTSPTTTVRYSILYTT